MCPLRIGRVYLDLGLCAFFTADGGVEFGSTCYPIIAAYGRRFNASAGWCVRDRDEPTKSQKHLDYYILYLPLPYGDKIILHGGSDGMKISLEKLHRETIDCPTMAPAKG
jgi:hypothetical protein